MQVFILIIQTQVIFILGASPVLFLVVHVVLNLLREQVTVVVL